LVEITDEYMMEMRKKTQPYTFVILHKTPKADESGADKIIWEHGRRNHQMRRDGVLRIALPVRDESNVAGIMVFSKNIDETKKIMDEDPGVKADIFVYEIHETRSFKGDAL